MRETAMSSVAFLFLKTKMIFCCSDKRDYRIVTANCKPILNLFVEKGVAGERVVVTVLSPLCQFLNYSLVIIMSFPYFLIPLYLSPLCIEVSGFFYPQFHLQYYSI